MKQIERNSIIISEINININKKRNSLVHNNIMNISQEIF
jgi:hypothetical protein